MNRNMDRSRTVMTEAAAALSVRLRVCYREARTEPDRAIISLLGEHYRSSCALIATALRKDGDGLKAAACLSSLRDDLIAALCDLAAGSIFHLANPLAGEIPAVLAVGGYGRRLCALGSDLDLLFLTSQRLLPGGEKIVEYVCYRLWDLGFRLGYAVRSLAECLDRAAADHIIATTLLDARLIWGDRALFQRLQEGRAESLAEVSTREKIRFIAAKLDEREQRHMRSGRSRYRVEPDVKNGKGGLRDLDTLSWIMRYLDPAPEPTTDLLRSSEWRLFNQCRNFLWTVRHHLHFLADHAQEVLSFAHQPEIAMILRYRDRGGLISAERFMKHYFLITRDVGFLTGVLCSGLEARALKMMSGNPAERSQQALTIADKSPADSGQLDLLSAAQSGGFIMRDGRLSVESAALFADKPVAMLRLFYNLDRDGLEAHPDALWALRQHLPRLNGEIRNDRESNALFGDILTSRRDPETILRRMNEAGVLGQFIPDFRRIVAMMQFNMYHHYTVDEHVIRAVGVLAEIEQGRCVDPYPVSDRLIRRMIDHRRPLYLATFLHDVAKGCEGDHSIVGERIARKLARRLDFTAAERELTAWLVRHHLAMSDFAQKRDLNDARTVRNFAALVGVPERLDLLLVLTVADIRAVGPGVWTRWKGQLLHQLHDKTEAYLKRCGDEGIVNIRRARYALGRRLRDWPRAARYRFYRARNDDYWSALSLDHQELHARLERLRRDGRLDCSVIVRSGNVLGQTEIGVLARRRRALPMLLTGACSAYGADLVEASLAPVGISGAGAGAQADWLCVRLIARDRAVVDDGDRRRDWHDGLARSLRVAACSAERGAMTFAAQIARQRRNHRAAAFVVDPEIIFQNDWSDHFSALEVSCFDHPGLLFMITRLLSALGLDIVNARAATFGERAVDVFYITDAGGAKIVDPSRCAAIADRLRTALTTPHTPRTLRTRISA